MLVVFGGRETSEQPEDADAHAASAQVGADGGVLNQIGTEGALDDLWLLPLWQSEVFDAGLHEAREAREARDRGATGASRQTPSEVRTASPSYV